MFGGERATEIIDNLLEIDHGNLSLIIAHFHFSAPKQIIGLLRFPRGLSDEEPDSHGNDYQRTGSDQDRIEIYLGPLACPKHGSYEVVFFHLLLGYSLLGHLVIYS